MDLCAGPPRFGLSSVRPGSGLNWGFPKIRVTFWGGPILRIIVFGGLYWGPPILGKYQLLFDLQVKLFSLIFSAPVFCRSAIAYRNMLPLKWIEYGFGYFIIRSPYTPHSIYLRGTVAC